MLTIFFRADLWVPEAGNGFSPSYDCESSSSCEDLNEQVRLEGPPHATAHLRRG